MNKTSVCIWCFDKPVKIDEDFCSFECFNEFMKPRKYNLEALGMLAVAVINQAVTDAKTDYSAKKWLYEVGIYWSDALGYTLSKKQIDRAIKNKRVSNFIGAGYDSKTTEAD